MSTRRRPWGAAAASLVSAALIFALAAPGSALAAPMPDYPSWQDVENARRSQAATQAQIDQLEGLLLSLQNEAVELGKVAQIKAEEYAQAQDALAAATQKVTRLEARADKAQERADESAARAARLIAQLARTGGGDLTLGLLMGSADDTDQLLSRLGSMNRVTESSADILQRAEFDRNLASSLGDDAKVAERIRTDLADDAERAKEKAEAAFDEADAQVAEQEKNADRMYAQLARLKGTTAAIEKKYQEGLLEEEEDDPPVTNPPTNPNPPVTNPPTNPNPTPTNPTPPPGVDPTPDPPVATTVQKAIAYAKAQLGEAYGFGGSGPSTWDCSGLTKASYASAGVYIGTHSASNQYNTMKANGRLVAVSKRQAGDLLFYSSGGSASATKYHVAIYIGGGQMIEAPRPGLTVRIVAVRPWDLVGYAGRPTG